MSSRFSVVDVSQFTSMEVIKVPDQELILNQRMKSFVDTWAKYDPPLAAQYDVAQLEFDPAKIVNEAATVYQVNVETRINQTARALTLAFAVGTDLDAIASRYPGGVPRVESEQYSSNAPLAERALKDNRYRNRIWLSPSILAAAGTGEAYEFLSLTALPEARDVSATAVRTPSEVIAVMTVMMEGDNPIPTQAQMVKVRAALLQEGVAPLTDVIQVQAPGLIDVSWNVIVNYYPWAAQNWAQIAQQIQANIDAFIDRRRWLGVDIADQDLKALFTVNGVHSVVFDGTKIPESGAIQANDTQLIRVTRFTFEKGVAKR